MTTLAACSASQSPDAAPEPGSGPSGGATPGQTEAPEPEVPPVRLMSNVEKGARDVPVDTRLTLEADGGTLRKVAVTSAPARARRRCRATT